MGLEPKNCCVMGHSYGEMALKQGMVRLFMVVYR